jgi:hypothetical protein
MVTPNLSTINIGKQFFSPEPLTVTEGKVQLALLSRTMPARLRASLFQAHDESGTFSLSIGSAKDASGFSA